MNTVVSNFDGQSKRESLAVRAEEARWVRYSVADRQVISIEMHKRIEGVEQMLN